MALAKLNTRQRRADSAPLLELEQHRLRLRPAAQADLAHAALRPYGVVGASRCACSGTKLVVHGVVGACRWRWNQTSSSLTQSLVSSSAPMSRDVHVAVQVQLGSPRSRWRRRPGARAGRGSCCCAAASSAHQAALAGVDAVEVNDDLWRVDGVDGAGVRARRARSRSSGRGRRGWQRARRGKAPRFGSQVQVGGVEHGRRREASKLRRRSAVEVVCPSGSVTHQPPSPALVARARSSLSEWTCLRSG